MNENRFFKGWAKPGPEVPGDLATLEGESLDSISGHFRLFQLENGHRFSTDDLLVAWYGTSWAPCPAKVLDLGSGVGSVGMIAAWRLPGSSFVTVEAQEQSVQLARKSAQYNGLLSRYEIRRGDFRDSKILADDERFDLILGSPPYFPLGSGIESDHPQKVACRFEVRGDISDYCRVASAHLNWGGLFACVFPITPEEQGRRVERTAHESGLSIIRRRPIIFREGEPPLLSVFAMSRADHLPPVFRDRTWDEPALTIRCRDGSVHPEYQAVKLAIGFPP